MRAIPILLLPVLILSGHGCDRARIQPEPEQSAAEMPVKPDLAANRIPKQVGTISSTRSVRLPIGFAVLPIVPERNGRQGLRT